MTSLKPFSATHFIQTSCLIVFSCMLFINHAKADESKGENMVSPDKMISGFHRMEGRMAKQSAS